jgi:radical SAM protein with 4Fe4S-binding SPASM domain
MTPIPKLKNLQLRLTRRCNIRCTHCYTTSGPELSGDYFPLESAKTLIDDAIPLGLEMVTLIGGEPLLHPNFPEIVEHIAIHPGLILELETNGMLIHKFSDVLSDFPRDFIVEISIDGAEIRGSSVTEKAFQALTSPVGLGKLCVQTLCCYQNLDKDFYSICERVHQLNIDHVIYMGPSGCGRGKDHTYLRWDDCKMVIKRIVANGWNNIRLELPPLITKQSVAGCGWNSYRCEILPDGAVTPCVQAYYEDAGLGVGNAFREPLAEIWRSSQTLLNLRRIDQSQMSGACRTCDYWEGCFGSCRSWAKSWDEENKWTAPYWRCEEYLQDNTLDESFIVPHKEIRFLKFPWMGTEYSSKR